jgi:acylphosphatase
MDTRRIRVKGRVQGVGFRYALRDEAERLGLTGWVRNRADGSVEALVQGEVRAIERLVAWARRGPPAAHVTAVEDEPTGLHGERPYARFEIRPSA